MEVMMPQFSIERFLQDGRVHYGHLTKLLLIGDWLWEMCLTCRCDVNFTRTYGSENWKKQMPLRQPQSQIRFPPLRAPRCPCTSHSTVVPPTVATHLGRSHSVKARPPATGPTWEDGSR